MQSVMGGVYPGPGITLGPGLAFGYLAARHAVARGKASLAALTDARDEALTLPVELQSPAHAK
jgi:hypothetical protein